MATFNGNCEQCVYADVTDESAKSMKHLTTAMFIKFNNRNDLNWRFQ